jgi:hypothetical protein
MDLVTQETVSGEKLENDFDSCVLRGSAFPTEVAIYTLSLGEDKSTEVSNARNKALESAKSCKADAQMMADQDMTLEQEWNLLCGKAEGVRFAEDFANFAMKKKPELLETSFDSLATCFDKTIEIINSILAKKNGA